MEAYTLVRLYAKALEREVRSSATGRLSLSLAVLWIALAAVTFWVGSERFMDGIVIIFPVSRVLMPMATSSLAFKELVLLLIPLFLGTVTSAVAYAEERRLSLPRNTVGALRCVGLMAQHAGLPHLLIHLPLYLARGMGDVLVWFAVKVFLAAAAVLRSMREFEGKELAFGYEELAGDVDDLSGATTDIASIMRRYGEEVRVCEATERWREGDGLGRKLFLLAVWLLFGGFGHIEGRELSILVRRHGVLVGGRAERVRTFYVEARKTLLFSLVSARHEAARTTERELNAAFRRAAQGGPVDLSVFVKEVLGLCKEPELEENEMESLLLKLDALYAR